jgi:tetratricopeptide (TPR) repeat protein
MMDYDPAPVERDTMSQLLDDIGAQLGLWQARVGASASLGTRVLPRGADLLGQLLAPRLVPQFGDRASRLASACAAGDPDSLATAEVIRATICAALPALAQEFGAAMNAGDPRPVAKWGGLLGDAAGIGGDLDTASNWWQGVARAAFRLQDYKTAEEACQRSLDWADGHVAPAELAATHDIHAQALHQLGRIPEALDAFGLAEALDAFDLAVDLGAGQDAARLEGRHNWAFFLLENGFASDAAEMLKNLLASPTAARLPPVVLGIIYDTYGRAIFQSGIGTGLAELAAAGELLKGSSARHRIIHLLIRADIERRLQQFDDAAVHFQAAWELAQSVVEQSPYDQMRYQMGLLRASTSRVDPPAARSAFEEGMQLWGAGKFAEARNRFHQVEAIASEVGDQWLSLAARSSLAGLFADTEDVETAMPLCRAGLAEARAAGLAQFAGYFAGILASLIHSGADDAGSETDRLLLLAEAGYLGGLHHHHQRVMDIWTTLSGPYGHFENDLGLFAREYGDLGMARDLLTRAVADAVANEDRSNEALRRSNLIRVLAVLRRQRPHDPDVHREIADNIVALEVLVARDDLDASEQQSARITLHEAKPWLTEQAELSSLRDLAASTDKLRAEIPSAAARAAIDGPLGVLEQLRQKLSETGEHPEAWETLQRMRARGLMEELTSTTGTTSRYKPPTVAEAADLLVLTATAERSPSVLVDVVATGAGLAAYLVDLEAQVLFVDVPGDLTQLNEAHSGSPDSRIAKTRQLMREDLLVESAGRVHAVTEGADLLLSVADSLANLPWSAASVGGQPWGEVQLIGRIPAIGVLRFGANRWSGTSFVAGDSLEDLPYARQECENVADVLGVAPRLGAECTLGALQGTREQTLDFLHLAVHGYADARRGGRATLVLADPEAGVGWVPFDTLARLSWRARVVVLSGCSTAVGGPRNGSGLFGIAQTAMTHGANTVVATLWPVNDLAASKFMTAFHADVRAQLITGDADLRLSLRHAANATAEMLISPQSLGAARTRGMRELIVRPRPGVTRASTPHESAVGEAFVVMGDPIIRHRPERS